ncbi:MAG: ABC transporter ATP-binding protein [Alcaligenaceae bacterium]|nr:ABC transporter ATP-binding protein [Alcaligenaceae bacterium]
MLRVEKINTSYGKVPVLFNVSFDIEQNEILGVLGHNGMGKTTLLRTLAGYLRPTSGEIFLDERNLKQLLPEKRARLGLAYVAQGRGIFTGLSVHENLLFAKVANKHPGVRDVDEIIDIFPRLKPLLERRGGALSGGEQQLLALARALIINPKVLLLDEPTEGIQPSILDEIIDTIKALRVSSELSILLVEQNLDFIKSLSDRILILNKGSIEKEVLPNDLSDEMALGDFS